MRAQSRERRNHYEYTCLVCRIPGGFKAFFKRWMRKQQHISANGKTIQFLWHRHPIHWFSIADRSDSSSSSQKGCAPMHRKETTYWYYCIKYYRDLSNGPFGQWFEFGPCLLFCLFVFLFIQYTRYTSTFLSGSPGWKPHTTCGSSDRTPLARNYCLLVSVPFFW